MWLGLKFKTGEIFARTRRYRTLEILDRREVGRYDAPILESLPGFRIGMMVAIFHIVGMSLVFSERLEMSVREERAVGTR